MNKSIRLTLVTFALGLACLFGGFVSSAHAASFAYDSFLDDTFAGSIVKTDTFKCALVTGYTPNQTTHTRWSDVQAFEITGTGYTAGGNTVVPTWTKDTTNHRMTIVFPQTTWTSSTLSATRAVCYKSTGTASTSPLIFQDDFGSTVTTSAGTFTLNASTLNVGTPQ